jgi:hypothetical protein
MNTSQNLTEQMTGKTDQQLLDIFSKPSDWSSEALGAAKAELQKRGIPIPDLPPPPPPLSEAEKRKKRLKRDGWLLLVGGLIAAAIVGNIKPDAWPKFGDGSPVIQAAAAMASTACWIIGIIVLIRAACIKTKK